MYIGIVGSGSAAVAHIKALEAIDSVSNIILYARNVSRAKGLATEFHKVIATDSLASLIPSVQGIIIATPNNTHLAILEEIIAIKSIPVLCEKPLASTIEEAEKFARLAPKLSIIGFNYRFHPAVSFLKKNILPHSIQSIEIALNRNSAWTKTTVSWRDNGSQGASSGALGDVGSHLLDLVQYLTGSSINKASMQIALETRVKSRNGIILTGDDYAIATGNTQAGITFRITASKACDVAELGFHIKLYCDDDIYQYSSQTPYYLAARQFIELNTAHVILDPTTEIPYWSDCFLKQDVAWIQQLRNHADHPNLADIKTGFEIQNLLCCQSSINS